MGYTRTKKQATAGCRAFTLIELLVVVAVIALLIGLLLPALGGARRSAQQVQNASNLRSMHQGMFVFGGDHDGFYPGLRSTTGEFTKDTVPNDEIPQAARLSWLRGDNILCRYLLLLHAEYVEPQNIISPVELDEIPNSNGAVRVEYDPSRGATDDPSAPEGYRPTDIFWSYSMLQISADQSGSGKAMLKKILPEWKTTSNSLAPVLSDRPMNFNALPLNEFFPYPDRHDSLWTGPHNVDPNDPSSKGSGWVGSVAYNDGHTEFIKQTSVINNTRFGAGRVNALDSLFTFDDGFDPDTRSDAVFVAHYATTPVIR